MPEQLPDGWRYEPLRNLAEVVSGGTPSRFVPEFWEGGTIPWVTPTDLAGAVGRFLVDTKETITERGLRSSNARLLPRGTLLMTSRATLGAIRISVDEVCTNQGFKSLIPAKGVDGQFLFYQMSLNRKRYEALGIGSTFLEINKRDTEQFKVPTAPIAEQRRIAEILSTVDEAIERTEAFIAKMQQIKAGLMHDLFTRGVTRGGQLRPPREKAPQLYKVSPLGWIPREWDHCSLGRLAEIVSGITLGQPIPVEGIEVPYLRVANVQDGYLDLRELKTIVVDPRTIDRLKLREGDVLMNEGGDFDKLGRGTVWTNPISPCIHQNHVFRVRPRNELLRSRFLAYWSQSEYGKKYFVLSSKQSTNLASINSTQLHRFPVVEPPPNEQLAIEQRLVGIDSHLAMLRDHAEKFSSLKAGIMHDLLTGRVRIPAAEVETA
jgi:type I restriction enzyme S subunit